jgi:N-acetylmuramoyl-L-alanine amidase
MLNDYMRLACWQSWEKTDINSSSIGIELDNNGTEAFSELQITSLMALLVNKKEYNIPTQNIIGHSDLAPSRKTDQEYVLFRGRPWLALESGQMKPTAAPITFNAEQGLRIIGYDTKIFRPQ